MMSNYRIPLLTLLSIVIIFFPNARAFAQEECSGAINYEDADIRSVVDEIALRTGRKFVLDPRVQGRVTVKSGPNGGLCADEAWELFQAMLRVNGFTATPINGGSYKIVPVQEGPRSAGPVGEGRAGDLVTQIIRLRYIDAREASANLTQIVNERGVVAPVRSGNALIVVDTSDNIERIRKVLQQIDRDPTVFQTVELNNASATEVASVLQGLAQEIAEDSNQTSNISIVPVEASNSILIRAEPDTIRRFTNVVTELDRIGGDKSDLSVIPLNHTDAEEMSTLLREIANANQGSGNPEGPPGGGRQRASISFHQSSNSIIISGDADIQQRLRSVVLQLDVRQAQVLIEAIIVDISDTTAREIGVEYFISGDGSDNNRTPFTTSNFSRLQPSVLASAGSSLLSADGDAADFDSSAIAQAAIGSLLSTSGFGIGGIGQSGGTIFGGILTAIKQDTNSNILSTPFATTLNNQTASLSVGQEIPITTGEQIGDDFSNAFRTVSREEVGVILEVTPKINEGGTVTLEISQEISSVAGPIIDSSTDLITNKTRFTTTALVDDGDILIIGGLVDQAQSEFEDGVPFLSEVPGVGNLFKNTGRSNSRRNLMVFIRPTILRNSEDSGYATKRKFDYIRAREQLFRGQPTSEVEEVINNFSGIRAPSKFNRRAPAKYDSPPPTRLERNE